MYEYHDSFDHGYKVYEDGYPTQEEQVTLNWIFDSFPVPLGCLSCSSKKVGIKSLKDFYESQVFIWLFE